MFIEVEISFYLLRRLLGVKTSEGAKQAKVQKLQKQEILMVNIGSTATGGKVLAVKADLAKILLTQPVCTTEGEKIALSRRVDKHWRLIGWGQIRRERARRGRRGPRGGRGADFVVVGDTGWWGWWRRGPALPPSGKTTTVESAPEIKARRRPGGAKRPRGIRPRLGHTGLRTTRRAWWGRDERRAENRGLPGTPLGRVARPRRAGAARSRVLDAGEAAEPPSGLP